MRRAISRESSQAPRRAPRRAAAGFRASAVRCPRDQLAGDPATQCMGFPAALLVARDHAMAGDQVEQRRPKQLVQQGLAERPRRRSVHDRPDDDLQPLEVAVEVEGGRAVVAAVFTTVPEVAGVVGQHADDRVAGVGPHDEQDVLQAPVPLGEGDAVARAGRRCGTSCARSATARARCRRPRHLDPSRNSRRGPTIVPAVLPTTTSAPETTAEIDQPLQRPGREPVVLVDELDELTARHRDADVARLARPAGVLLVVHPHVGVLAREVVQERAGAVRRAVST